MKNADPDKDSGGPVPLARKNLSDVTCVGPHSHLGASHLHRSQLGDPSGHLLRHFGLPGSNLHHPFHLAALSSQVYSPHFLGHNINPASILASLSRRDEHVPRGGRAIQHPIIRGSSSPHTLASLHATLAAGDASRPAELLSLLKDSTRQHELLFALSKLTAPSGSSTSSSMSMSPSLSTSPSSSSFHLSSSLGSPSKQSNDTSPIEKHSRASSLSPSSYMTPRSLTGSPSSFSLGVSPNLNSHILSSSSLSTIDSLSPTSPNEDGSSTSTSTGTTPTRKLSTPRPDRVFTCKICNRSFGYKHVLQNHERTHTGEKPFECKECHKRFTRDHHLKTHMRLHTGEKPYHCTHCDRQFVQVANLRRHLRVHTGEKPYSCENCSSKFSDSNQLKAHMLIHKGEKPFGCNKCFGKFRRRHHLIHHKCSRESDGANLGNFGETLGTTSLPDSEHFGYVENLFPNDEIDDDDLGNERMASPTSTIESTTILADEEPIQMEKRRERKNKEPRRVVSDITSGMSSPSSTVTFMNAHLPLTPQPEQTEPEDLSINGSRRVDYHNHTYRANIALTTSSRYGKNPFKYPSSPEGTPNLNKPKGMDTISANL